MSIALELDMAENLRGKLSDAVRRRLLAYDASPTSELWNDIYSIIVGPHGFTVWLAWVATSANAPQHKDDSGHWPRHPSRHEFRRALAYATH